MKKENNVEKKPDTKKGSENSSAKSRDVTREFLDKGFTCFQIFNLPRPKEKLPTDRMSQVNPNEPFAAFVRSPERFWYEIFLINPTPDVYRETFTVSGGYVSGKTLYGRGLPDPVLVPQIRREAIVIPIVWTKLDRSLEEIQREWRAKDLRGYAYVNGKVVYGRSDDQTKPD